MCTKVSDNILNILVHNQEVLFCSLGHVFVTSINSAVFKHVAYFFIKISIPLS